MSDKKSDDDYSPEEAKKRLEAALRGARLAGHKPMESLINKNSKAKKKKTAKKVKRLQK